jgi:hypothetical protein
MSCALTLFVVFLSNCVGAKLRKAQCILGEVEAKTNKKPSLNRSAKDRRNTLFRVLNSVLSLSHKKFMVLETATNQNKAGQELWFQPSMVSAVSTYRHPNSQSFLTSILVNLAGVDLEPTLPWRHHPHFSFFDNLELC